MRMPASIHGSFQGTAAAFQDSLSSEPMLILTALLAVYIVLGMLYESYIHPITILSTLPSAGTGAMLALLLFHMQLDVIGLIGIILLIGIVKKNAIMMIDFALEVERSGKSAEEAIYEAGLVRFRPIMMTTMAAMLGALPLALGTGVGSEIRRPLGVAIVGGLIVSQALTLYTTPVVYLYMDNFKDWVISLIAWTQEEKPPSAKKCRSSPTSNHVPHSNPADERTPGAYSFWYPPYRSSPYFCKRASTSTYSSGSIPKNSIGSSCSSTT